MEVRGNKSSYVASRGTVESVAEVEIWSASLAEACQPCAEANREPSAQVEGAEEYQFDSFEGRADGVEHTYFGVLLWHCLRPRRLKLGRLGCLLLELAQLCFDGPGSEGQDEGHDDVCDEHEH